MNDLWGDDSIPDISAVFRSCLGYSRCPGWAFIRGTVENLFGGFKGLKTIELGCGEGKVSLLFSLLGGKTTLVDSSGNQLIRAKYIAKKFEVQPVFLKENLLQLPKSLGGQYDISMSFGTAEHFSGGDRQRVFNIHSAVLRKGGLSILWVPNRYGILFQLGVTARKLFHRRICEIGEIPFTRKELAGRARKAGLIDIRVIGGESFSNDFNNFLLDARRILRLPSPYKAFIDARSARTELMKNAAENNAPIRAWNNLFSYPLILLGRNI